MYIITLHWLQNSEFGVGMNLYVRKDARSITRMSVNHHHWRDYSVRSRIGNAKPVSYYLFRWAIFLPHESYPTCSPSIELWDRCQESLPHKPSANVVCSYNVYLTATTQKANIFSRNSQEMKCGFITMNQIPMANVWIETSELLSD